MLDFIMSSMWDERFAESGWAYGSEPNDFVKTCCAGMTPGKALCLAEGQGRNAVYLAGLGFDVTAVDLSSVGLERAAELAKEKQVSITTLQADLSEYHLGDNEWDLIVAIFAHLPSGLRKSVHGRVVQALCPGGAFVLEAYTPEQLKWKTGGPKDIDMLMSAELLREDLAGLDFEILREVEREFDEGNHHQGIGATVQVLAKRRS